MKHRSLTRMLALDLHARSFGYVVVESPDDRLLDWGVRSHRFKKYSAQRFVRTGLRPLLDVWQPTVIVVQNPTQSASRGRRSNLLNQVAREAKNRRVQLGIRRKSILGGERLTKHEIARRAAERFSILRWRMPLKRRAWESEDYRMSMFCAADAALAHLQGLIRSHDR
jgi:hypothetical protein